MTHPIHCPRCGSSFELGEVLAERLEQELERRVSTALESRTQAIHAAHERALAAREAELVEAARIEHARQAEEARAEHLRVAREVEERLRQEAHAERTRLLAEASDRVRAELDAARVRHEEEQQAAAERLARAAQEQRVLLEAKRALEDRARTADLVAEQRIAAITRGLREEAAREEAARVAQALAEQRAALEADVARTRAEQAGELEAARAQLSQAQAAEVELRQQKRQVEERERALAVEVERRVDEAVGAVRGRTEAALREVELRREAERRQHDLQLAEARLEKQSIEAQVKDLQRKLDQGSQQLQGEAQEVTLEAMLQRAFPADLIREVGKGVSGADVLQDVRLDGRLVGTIVWESKRTKAWQKEWLGKLRENQREAGACCAILVSQVLPEALRTFGELDGVWVTAWEHAVAVASVLRQGVLDVGRHQLAGQARDAKAQRMYEYLLGTEFRNRIQGVLEPLVELQHGLVQERSALRRIWARREQQLERAISNLNEVTGHIGGIAGHDLEELDGIVDLEAAALPAATAARALPPRAGATREGGPGDDQGADRGDPDEDDRRQALLLSLLPEDGSAVGNMALQRQLRGALGLADAAFTEHDYRPVRDALVEAGLARRCAGRGGALARVVRQRLEPAA